MEENVPRLWSCFIWWWRYKQFYENTFSSIYERFSKPFSLDFKKDEIFLFDGENIYILKKDYIKFWKNQFELKNIFRQEKKRSIIEDFLDGNFYVDKEVKNYSICPKENNGEKIFEYKIKYVLGKCFINIM